MLLNANEIAKKLRALRAKQKMSQDGLSEASGTSVNTIAKMERGELKSIACLERVAAAYCLDLRIGLEPRK